MKELKDFFNQKNLDEELTKIKRNLVNDRRLMKYLEQQRIQLTTEMVENSLINLLTFNDNYFKCEGCKGLEYCKQEMRGYRPELEAVGDRLHLIYKPCKYQIEWEKKQSVADNIRAFYLPKSILNADISKLDIDVTNKGDGRNQAINKIFSFASTYDGMKFQRGVYLYGPFGVGKTFMLAAMANEIAKKGIQVGVVYLPDLIRELKSAIGTHSLESKLDEIKNIKVLVLDDIGAEMVTAWVRDEILGPLLQFRLLEQLPTFFTSNKSIDELIHDYSRTTDGSIDKSKANRIGDRIKALSVEQYIEGKNYRY